MKTMKVAGVVSAALWVLGAVGAGTNARRDDLLQLLPKSRHSLADGIRQVSKSPEAAISAKFEIHEGHLALSVYTAEKELSEDPEHNVLKEYIGSPEGTEWKPEIEVFKDVPHVSRSAMQLTLMSLSRFSLLDIVKKAEKDHPGTVYAVIPILRERKARFMVRVAAKGRSVDLEYDAMTGEAVK